MCRDDFPQSPFASDVRPAYDVPAIGGWLVTGHSNSAIEAGVNVSSGFSSVLGPGGRDEPTLRARNDRVGEIHSAANGDGPFEPDTRLGAAVARYMGARAAVSEALR